MGERGNSLSLLRVQRAIPACRPECARQGRGTVMAFILLGVSDTAMTVWVACMHSADPMFPAALAVILGCNRRIWDDQGGSVRVSGWWRKVTIYDRLLLSTKSDRVSTKREEVARATAGRDASGRREPRGTRNHEPVSPEPRFSFSRKGVIRSMGRGNTTVVFLSAPITVSVSR